MFMLEGDALLPQMVLELADSLQRDHLFGLECDTEALLDCERDLDHAEAVPRADLGGAEVIAVLVVVEL